MYIVYVCMFTCVGAHIYTHIYVFVHVCRYVCRSKGGISCLLLSLRTWNLDLIDSVWLDLVVYGGSPLALPPTPLAGMTGEPPCPLVIYISPGEPSHNPYAFVARSSLTKPFISLPPQ